MKIRIIDFTKFQSEDEAARDYNAMIVEEKAKGLRIAASSNTGLPEGNVRFTFLPKEAFEDDDAPQLPEDLK